MIVETERLRMHVASEEEMTALVERHRDEALGAAYREMLRGCLENPEHWEWYAAWMIDLKGGGHAGELSFKGPGRDGTVEIGYGVLEEYRGRGFATEAVNGAVDWALGRPGVKCVEAETEPGNGASRRVLAKCGFLPLGVAGEEGPRYARRRGDEMIAYCGLDCGKCDAFLATVNDDQALREKTASLWSELNHVPISPEQINCDGCRAVGRKTVFCDSLCEIRKCAVKKSAVTCGDCSEMEACGVLKPIVSTNPSALCNLRTWKRV